MSTNPTANLTANSTAVPFASVSQLSNTTGLLSANATLSSPLANLIHANGSDPSAPPTASVLSAYLDIVRRCDDPAERDPALQFNAYAFSIVYGFGILLQLSVLPANLRLSRMRSAFLFILYTNVLDLFWLLEYVWLSAEFLIGHRLHLPFTMEAFVFRFINFSIDALYVQLSVNRSMAVALPFFYAKLFTLQTSARIIAGTFCCALVYTVFINWFPEQRPFHCLAQLGYIEPTTEIDKQLLIEQIPDTELYIWVERVYLVVIFIPVTLYMGTFAYMAYNYCKRRYAHSTQTAVTTIVPSATNTTMMVPSMANSSEQRAHANLMLERTRLYLMCFFSTVPYYLSNSLDYYTRIFQVSPSTVQVLSIFWQLFGMIFHVQQPLLMLWLSRDLRREVRKDTTTFCTAVWKVLTRKFQ